MVATIQVRLPAPHKVTLKIKYMKVNRKAGNRNSWQEMDIESRQAVYLAERLVEDKRGVEAGGKRYNNCTLEIRYGNNIYNTQIDIVDNDGLVIALYSDGYFYDSTYKQQVELF